MKRLLSLAPLAALLVAAVVFAACSSGSGSDSDPAESDAGDNGGQTVAGVCAEGFEDCVDTVVNGDAGITGSCAEDAAAPECVAEEPPIDPADDAGVSPGTVTYDVTIAFDESVTQDDMDLAAEAVRTMDGDAGFVIQESFPPVGRASITTNDGEACAVLTEELMDVHGVGDVTCTNA